MKEIKPGLTEIEKVDLLFVILKKRNEMWRLAQVCCVCYEDTMEYTYSFAKGLELENYRLVVAPDEEVPSISRVYESAIFYENEMRELFGANIQSILVDYHNEFYHIDEITPFKAFTKKGGQ